MCKEQIKAEEVVFKKPRQPSKKRTYSNQLTDCVKIFCGVCDQVINLSGLRKHLIKLHKMGTSKYSQLYGNPKTQIIKMMYHQCGICRQDVVLDYDALSKHLKNVHKLTGKGASEYNSQHLKMIRVSKSMRAIRAEATIATTTTTAPTVSPQTEATTLSLRVAPVPTCNLCTRLFRSNMQLKMHMRREHADK